MHEDDVLRLWHRLRGGGALEKRAGRPGSHHAHKRSTVHEKSPVEAHLGRAGFNIISALATKRALRGHCESNIREACDGSADDAAVQLLFVRWYILALRGFIRMLRSAAMELDQVTSADGQKALPPEPQAVVQAVTRAAIFLVATINGGAASRAAVRSFCGDLPALLRSVGTRNFEGNLSCIMGIGSNSGEGLF